MTLTETTVQHLLNITGAVYRMKNRIFIIWISGFSLVCQAQTVFQVKYQSQADLKVFPVKYQSQADLKVFRVPYRSMAGKDGLWYYEKYESQADLKIFFVKHESQADLKIYFVDHASQAGWINRKKMHLLKI